jgi:hypothetical protein
MRAKKMRTKTMRTAASFAALLLLMITFSAGSVQAAADLDTEKRLLHSRAFESILWSVPLMNYKAIKDGLKNGGGVNYGDVAYNSKIQTAVFEIPTGNSVPYIMAYWTLKDGPMVIEVPSQTADVALFGVFMDSWQRPLADVGGKGRDGGVGAKYLLLPPNYQADELPEGYLVLQSKTYEGYFLLRPGTVDNSAKSMAKQSAWAKTINIYPLAKAAKPPKTKHVDIYRKPVHAIIDFDATYFGKLQQILNTEIIEEKDLAILGILNGIGIRKGGAFKMEASQKEIYTAAASEAHQYVMKMFLETLPPEFYSDKKWTTLNLPGSVATQFSYVQPNFVDIDTRGSMYFGVFSSTERLGRATFYLSSAKTSNGQWLEGGENYKLSMPANVPVNQYWSAVTYDNETASWIKGTPEGKQMVGSLTDGLRKNKDGSIDIYFGPKAPKGLEKNWMPTVKGRRFFVMVRFYGPKQALFTQTWTLPDVEKVK